MDDWKSPDWVLDLFDGWFDPCPLHSLHNGLMIDWRDETFVNPPYSKPLPWVMKAIEENKKGKSIALLLKLDSSTKYHKLLIENNAHVLLPNERLRFGDGRTPASFPSVIYFLSKTEHSDTQPTKENLSNGSHKIEKANNL